MSDSSDDEPLAVKKARLESKSANTVKISQKVKKEGNTKSGRENPSGADARAKEIKSEPVSGSKVGALKSAKKGSQGAKDSKSSLSAQVAVKREKKIYDLPGQTRDTPDELDPLRKFYSSLKLQRPQSQMAKKWLCMYGLLAVDEAEAFLKENGKNLRSPVKRAKGPQSSAEPRKQVQRKKSASVKKATAKKRDELSDEDTPAAGKRPRDRKASASQSEPAKRKPAALKGKYTVFEAGSLDSDSDDDKPLGLRV